MVTQGSGHIVNITTSLVDHAEGGARGAGVPHQGRTGRRYALAGDRVRGAGMRVNAVAPGVIKSPMHDAASYEGIAALHPLGRMGEISDIVDGILYLEPATFVTGEILHVDGGQAAGH